MSDLDKAFFEQVQEAAKMCKQSKQRLVGELLESNRTDLLGFPPVLDVCCGGRMMWYDKRDKRALCVDVRREEHHDLDSRSATIFRVEPDQIADFRNLPFPSDTFAHVVFDPPHCTRNSKNSRTSKKYGDLKGDWKEMLRLGFTECFRVLRPEGTLIFKWNETDILVSEILALTPQRPLYGHRSGKQSKTHWIAFVKPNIRI